MAQGKERKLGGVKYYSPSANKNGDPATLQPGALVERLTYQETVKAEKSKYDGVNHKFLEKGEPVIFNGAGMLNKLISDTVAVGDVINIEYVGKTPCPFGPNKGTLTHEYKITDYVEDAPTAGTSEAAATETSDDFT